MTGSGGPPKRHEPIPPWQVLESRYAYRDEWIALRSDTVALANGHVLSPYHIVEYPTWINVIAITPALDIVLVEEYRHGAGQSVVELPSGTLGDAAEGAEAAARRELLEETGYSAVDWYPLGSFFANPARQTNRVHSFLAIDVTRTAEPVLDAGEIIRTHLVPWGDFVAGIGGPACGLQAFHLAGLHLLQLHARKTADPRVRRLRLTPG